MKKLVFVLLALFSFLSWASLMPARSAQQPQDLLIKEYKIGPRDLLEIKVFELPELDNVTVRVSEDGSITLPLVQNIKVEGLTKDEVERKLAGLLEEKYLRNPQVSIFIKEYQSKHVALIGAVERPGMYQIIGKLSLLELLGEAGGLRDNASNEISVLREEKEGLTSMLTIDLEEMWANKNPKLNIPLQPNDVVNIPVDKIIAIYVFGEVKNPGALQVIKSKKIWLSQAIAQVGGPTEYASISKVTIKRRDKNGKENNIQVNLKDILKGKKPDVLLQEGDVVYVPESIF